MQSSTPLSKTSDEQKKFVMDDVYKAVKQLGKKYNYNSEKCDIFEIFILRLAGLDHSLADANTNGYGQTCMMTFTFKNLQENDKSTIVEKILALNKRFTDLEISKTEWTGATKLYISMNVNAIMLKLLPLFEVFLAEQSKAAFEVSDLKKYQEVAPYIYSTNEFWYEIDTLLQERRETRVANLLASSFENVPHPAKQMIIRYMGAPAAQQSCEGYYSTYYPDNTKPEETCEDSLSFQELIANAVHQELSKEEQNHFKVAEVAPRLNRHPTSVTNGQVTIAESLSLEVSEHIANFFNRIKPKSTTAGQIFTLQESKANTEEYTVDITVKSKLVNPLPKMYLLIGDQKVEVNQPSTTNDSLVKQPATLQFSAKPQDRYSIMNGGVPSVRTNASIFVNPTLRAKLLAIEAQKVNMDLEKPAGRRRQITE